MLPLTQNICVHCGGKITANHQHCPTCGNLVNGWQECKNCRGLLDPEDKYCRYCGTKAGEGIFQPHQIIDDFETIYGPMPVKRVHTCGNCGHSWTTCLMIDDENFCPKCGGQAPGSSKRVLLVNKTTTIEIDSFPAVLGKERLNHRWMSCADYGIDDAFVSKRHCKIESIKGSFFISDLQSTNGTYLNGRQLTPGGKAEVHSGDCIKIGDTELTFYADLKQ